MVRSSLSAGRITETVGSIGVLTAGSMVINIHRIRINNTDLVVDDLFDTLTLIRS
jgi:hypothetical protein